MAALILGWDIRAWNRWNYDAVVEHVAVTGQYLDRWTIGPRWNAGPGTEAWLLLQGTSDTDTGLIGHGVVMSEPFRPVADSPSGAGAWFVTVVFDALLPLGEQIGAETLRAAVPGVPWDNASGRAAMALTPSAEPGLRRLWREQGPTAAGWEELVSGTFPPQAVSRTGVNRYERDADARRVCLAFHGTSCAACGLSLETAYGEAGSDVLDVHHVVPPEIVGSGYQLDPITDLVPLCPNCHAMAHHQVAVPRTVPELRSLIAAAGHLKGEPVSEKALEAQEDARRILEAGRD